MTLDDILSRILKEYDEALAGSRVAEEIRAKVQRGTATYVDAERFAQECGQLLAEDLRVHLREVLTNGMLYRDTAETVLKKPMLHSTRSIDDITRQIQNGLNTKAGIGIGAFTPEDNVEHIDGIITEICNASSYESGEDLLISQVTNYLEGRPDEFARENADFQYQAGLSPRIERRAINACCEWCAAIVGTYEYDRVSNRGNDVFRRHRNCRCQVLFDPGDGSKRRQNVYTRKWTDAPKTDIINEQSERVSAQEKRSPERKVFDAAFVEQRSTKKNILTDAILENHHVLAEYTPESMYDFLQTIGYKTVPLSDGFYDGVSFQDGGGYKINFGGDGIFQYHPDNNSHHNGAYWKVSGNQRGKTRYGMDGNKK